MTLPRDVVGHARRRPGVREGAPRQVFGGVAGERSDEDPHEEIG